MSALLVTAKEAASMIGVSVDYLRRMERSGRFDVKFLKRSDKCAPKRYLVSDLVRWVNDNATTNFEDEEQWKIAPHKSRHVHLPNMSSGMKAETVAT